ncbi:histidine phosphatase family protein [Candidatus Falkowbacteria bacterium]|jgi:alpha-ribazole phosphatase/probable phosphoglycerate mutase|nr:histidine phosphatase family protein [Candidatus Falkowbacteria bacterium]
MYQSPYKKIKPKVHGPYTEIYLIRHCHPDYRKEKKLGEKNMPLSKRGIEQRKFLIKKLLTLKIDKVYSSEIVRALETATPFAKLIKKEVIVDGRLNEIDWKHWVKVKYFNMSEKTRAKKLKQYDILDKQLDEMQTVARRSLADIYRNSKGKSVAIFSHGNFIKSLVTGILNADIIGFLSLEIFQSSITKLLIDRDGFVTINYINDVGHLPYAVNEDLFKTLIS